MKEKKWEMIGEETLSERDNKRIKRFTWTVWVSNVFRLKDEIIL